VKAFTNRDFLLARMLNNIDGLCAERDRLKKEQPRPSKGKGVRRSSLVMREPLQWYDDNADNTPWIKALAEVRRLRGAHRLAYRQRLGGGASFPMR
jgi:hypothetical protein